MIQRVLAETRSSPYLKIKIKLLWIGTLKNGVDRLDLKSNKIIHFPLEQERTNGLLETRINIITGDNKGYLWDRNFIRFNTL